MSWPTAPRQQDHETASSGSVRQRNQAEDRQEQRDDDQNQNYHGTQPFVFVAVDHRAGTRRAVRRAIGAEMTRSAPTTPGHQRGGSRRSSWREQVERARANTATSDCATVLARASRRYAETRTNSATPSCLEQPSEGCAMLLISVGLRRDARFGGNGGATTGTAAAAPRQASGGWGFQGRTAFRSGALDVGRCR